MKKIFYTLLTVSAICYFSACAFLQDSLNERFAAPRDFSEAAGSFYNENGRWPQNVQELKDFTSQKYIPLDLAMFDSLELQETEKGALEVHYQYRFSSGDSGQFTIQKPQVPKK